MKELKGKYSEAKIYTDNIEQEAIDQVQEILDQQFVENSKVRIMPDAHAGKGAVIGFTMDIQDKVVPNLVGVDIGCGMLTVEFGVANDEVDLPFIDKIIHENVPSGKNVRNTIVDNEQSQMFLERLWKELRCANAIQNKNRIDLSLGTLGGGNHFIEVGKMDKRETAKSFFLVVHTGSRNLGKQVAEYYQEKAIKHCYDFSAQIKEEIQELKSSGKIEGKDLGEAIKAIHAKYENKVENKDLAYLEGQDMEDYLHDVKLCQEFADLNRLHIFDEIRKAYPSFLVLGMFNTIHNYIDFTLKGTFLRKGAISAYEGEKVLIPMNMRDGSIFALGKGNEDWNYSAPHGAGRLMSRSKARKTVDMEEYRDSMKGIYTTCVNESTIDESPMSYKPMDEIIANVEDTVHIVGVIKPIYNFKASE